MSSAGLDIPNDGRGSVMAHLANCITCEKLRGKADKVNLPRNSTHGDKVYEKLQMDFLECRGPVPVYRHMRAWALRKWRERKENLIPPKR